MKQGRAGRNSCKAGNSPYTPVDRAGRWRSEREFDIEFRFLVINICL